MSCLVVQVKHGEQKLERLIAGVPVILLPGYEYKLPIGHPREIYGLDGTSSTDSLGANPAGLIWRYEKDMKPMDLNEISRTAVMASRMRRAQVMARVRVRLDNELGKGWSDVEAARMERTKMDPDEHLLEMYNNIVAEDDKIEELPSRSMTPPKSVKRVRLETDEDDEPLNLPMSVCRMCGHKFKTRKLMQAHKRAVHDARKSKAKRKFHEGMDGKTVSFIEEAL